MTLGCIFSSWEVRTYCPIAQTELSITILSNIIYWNGIANKDILRGTNNLTLICTQLVFWLKSTLVYGLCRSRPSPQNGGSLVDLWRRLEAIPQEPTAWKLLLEEEAVE